MISWTANKYGRKLKQINLGTNPVQSTIYNKIISKEFSLAQSSPPVLEQTKYVTSFINANNVGVSYETLQDELPTSDTPASPGLTTSTGSNRVYPNGLARIFIPETASYLKFVLHKIMDGSNKLLNVNGVGDMVLSFADARGDAVEISEFPDLFADKGAGEVIFRITEAQAKSILELPERTFRIHLTNERSEKTLVYAGNFYSVDEYQTLVETDRITSLEDTVARQSITIQELTNLSDGQQEQITNLMNRTTKLSATITSDEELIRTLNETIADLNRRLADVTNAASDSARDNARNAGKPLPPKSPREETSRGNTFYEDELQKQKANVFSSKSSPFSNEG